LTDWTVAFLLYLILVALIAPSLPITPRERMMLNVAILAAAGFALFGHAAIALW
jgi:hypothetical protein